MTKVLSHYGPMRSSLGLAAVLASVAALAVPGQSARSACRPQLGRRWRRVTPLAYGAWSQ